MHSAQFRYEAHFMSFTAVIAARTIWDRELEKKQTLTTSPANHIRFLLVRANKFAKWKTGLSPDLNS